MSYETLALGVIGCSLALPLLALYEGSIIAVSIVEKKAAAAKSSTPGASSSTNPAE